MKLRFSVLSFLLACWLTGCGLSLPGSSKPTALATTTQIHDFVRQVGGDRIEVIGLLGPDTDAHAYEPTAEDARKVARARLIFTNGLDLEGPWLEALLKNARPEVPVVQLGDSVQPIALNEPGAGGSSTSTPDPHIWFDPTNVQRMTETIRDRLIALDPAGAEIYRRNQAAYAAQLAALDQEIREQIATIPPANRKLVTNHEAFGYYANRYGLTIVGAIIPSLSTEAQPSAADTARLISQIKAQQVKAIFTERSINPKLAEQIAREAGVKVYANLYSDSLGPPGSDGDTYLKMMRFNTRVIVEALR